MIKLVKNRVNSPDAVRRGWILVGFPETGVQAHMLQQAAVLAKHYINLQIPDEVVMERAKGMINQKSRSFSSPLNTDELPNFKKI